MRWNISYTIQDDGVMAHAQTASEKRPDEKTAALDVDGNARVVRIPWTCSTVGPRAKIEGLIRAKISEMEASIIPEHILKVAASTPTPVTPPSDEFYVI